MSDKISSESRFRPDALESAHCRIFSQAAMARKLHQRAGIGLYSSCESEKINEESDNEQKK